MNHAATSREALLHEAEALVRQEGASALSLRALSRRCGISAGTVYHYFADKGELVSALVEEGWRTLLDPSGGLPTGFLELTEWLLDALSSGSDGRRYLSLHGAEFDPASRDTGRAAMSRTLTQLRRNLSDAAQADRRLPPDLRTAPFADDLAGLVMTTAIHDPQGGRALLALLRRSCHEQEET